ncbi:MAG: DUF6483 family protein [Acutalibacter sp.]
MITEDYILRMIQEMGQMLARILGSDALDPTDQVQPETLHAGDGLGFLEELKALCSHGQVNLAEDRLFEELDFSAPSALITVLGFYEYVNSFSDQQLEAWGYSREEIYQGLADCGERFGVDPRLLGAFPQ